MWSKLEKIGDNVGRRLDAGVRFLFSEKNISNQREHINLKHRKSKNSVCFVLMTAKEKTSTCLDPGSHRFLSYAAMVNVELVKGLMLEQS